MEIDYKQQFKEFCDIFKGVSVEQAKVKADELGLPYNADYDLVDINYKNICATVYDVNGNSRISTSVELWNEEESNYELVEMEG